MITPGQTYSTEIKYSQEDVAQFAALTGDHNPIHLDEAYAATTPFKKPIIHGMLAASVFSKVFGTAFPGEGSIYLGQNIQFKRPMYVDVDYVAEFKLIEIDTDKKTCTIHSIIKDKTTQKVTIEGEARIMNKTAI